ncbi:long-chain fatty acid--CoA ligase [Alkalihalophilus lindianensis]|uniref:Long-chain fatty acid--CoA ligase n=1 Tax=Alkalihalophilus lindianensis TaxID=1630542 RepID=A0ABU3X6S7_9BACI|nr:long-chain fatty acid--CoA ligase [Alkalihalophilus lindianensis]MDV2683606.1 long-chain fatty acid--CoA ligase [Alkalihalophilus lindianensis]
MSIYNDKPWLSLYHKSVGETIQVDDLSLNDLFTQSVDKHKNKIAITFYDRTFTYEQVDGITKQYTSSLHSLGFTKGDRLAVMLPNTPHYLFTLFSVSKLGGIGVQVNPMYIEREIEHVLADSGAEYMIVLDQLYPRVKQIQEKTNLKHVIVVSLGSQVTEIDEHDFYFEDFLKCGIEEPPQVEINPGEDVAMLQYTGGTTGVSKGVMLTHRNLITNLEQIYEFMFKPIEYPDNPKIMSVLPMFHIYGLTCNVFLGFKCGCNQIILPRFDLQEVVETVKREKPFQFSGVPTMYVGLNSHPKLEEYEFDQVSYFNSGGSAMPIEQLHLFEKRTNCNLCEGYGLSEASPTTHFNPPTRERKVGSVGIPLPGLESKIIQETDRGIVEVPVGEVGELIVKGPQVMKGYWQREEETSAVLKDGWLFTGDLARMDENGYFYIVDRKKDMIIASGYNVYPREIEEILYQHPSIQEVIVVGVPDEYRGETVKAFITLKAGESTTEEEVISFTKTLLARYKVPKYVEIREELPKSAVGKLLRRKLRDEEVKKARS